MRDGSIARGGLLPEAADGLCLLAPAALGWFLVKLQAGYVGKDAFLLKLFLQFAQGAVDVAVVNGNLHGVSRSDLVWLRDRP